MAPRFTFDLSEESQAGILARFDRLSSLLIDTSSLIQIEKAGFLLLLARWTRLYTLRQVQEEYLNGSLSKSFPGMVQLLGESAHDGDPPRSTDTALLATAHTLRLPLVSEDRKLLLKADSLGMKYYNALMMLEFLYYRIGGQIEESSREGDLNRGKGQSREGDQSAGSHSLNYTVMRQNLLAQSRYSRSVLKYVEQLHSFIEKRVG